MCTSIKLGLDFMPVFHFKGTGQVVYKIYLHFDHKIKVQNGEVARIFF